ncbi:TRAP transporter small permease subunit [Celeribacter indicus]|uniref:TRAP-type mannitol/chloroaromatic compound transport system small permease-like protein n=1 Tax=Celeribacter indicus TaxID=1208324 RepID=A0A0B5DXG1_9RHOB|nr:TRAP transporter small permease subunit [Celeribacter indicus]AJE47664.1 TRAP-type mannitol/chloroaromatic compound transport system small permease-like protein [Celeribacter indicus]SDW13616.1 Tripartite ATP-independent transporter, DctQ component [Celeribacter indicus]
MEEQATTSGLGALAEAILSLFVNLGLGLWHSLYALSHPGLWLDWSDKENLARFVYYGGSKEFLFVFIDIVLILTVIGFLHRPFLWALVRGLEAIANTTGRIAAWAGLLMVLQQIMVVFLQSVFRQGEITIAPFGAGFTQSVGWFSESLKFENALVVALCVSYAFVQGAHVRVDLIYSGVGHRAKRAIDMFGSLVFMLPVALLTWMYAWFFLWRHLITPKVSATSQLDLLLRQSAVMRWNVETVSFSANGFNGYFLFKILMLAFLALVILQALAFFYRSFLEFAEGEESAGRYLDRDTLGEGEEAYEGTH